MSCETHEPEDYVANRRCDTLRAVVPPCYMCVHFVALG